MRVSIDIGAQTISIAEGKQKGNKVVVKNTLKVKTPPFCLKDGEILNVELLYDVIKNVFANNNVHANSISIGINSTSIITREFIVPRAKHNAIIQIIQNEMFQSSVVTTPYIIDYTILDVIEDENAKKYRVLAAAVPQHIVEGYIQLCKMLKFSNSTIDLEFNGIYKTFAIQPEMMQKEKPIIIASVGTNNAIFMILERGKIVFSKTISLNISKYINLTSDKKTIDYSKVDLTTNFSESRRRLVEEFAYDLAQEISKIMQFQLARSSYRSLDDIYLMGAITNAGGIEKRIGTILNTTVKAITKPDCIKTKLNFKYSQYVATIGGLITIGSDR